MITIALSTSIPIATINEAKDTRCNVPCIMYKTSNEPSTTITSPAPIIYPLRNPMKSITTRITITTDSIRLTMKTFMALFTRVGWKKTFWKSIPAGMISSFNSAILASTFFPS